MGKDRVLTRGGRAALVAILVVMVVPLGNGAAPTQAAAPLGGSIIRVNQVTTDAQDETTIAINPTNPRNLVAGSITYETGTGQCAAYASTDRGKTWSHQVLPNAPNFTAGGDPVVSFDSAGTAYYLCMNLFGTTNGTPNGFTQYVWRSVDGGQGWLGPVLALGSLATTEDKGHLTVDRHPASSFEGNIYAVATSGPCGPGELRFARSIDGALSFQPDQVVNDGGVISFAGNVVVGADGAVYVAWRDMTACGPSQSTNGILIDKSADGGQSFGDLVGGTDHSIRVGPIVAGVRPDQARGNGNPVLGAHPTNPNIVYALWGEDPAGTDDSDIFFARSMDGGDTWSAPIRVNDDLNPTGEFFSQFWPAMAVDPIDGEIDIVWYSDQNDQDRTDPSPLVDVYFSSSTDDGQSFTPSVRLTPASSTMPLAQPFNFFGDYIGIDALGGVAHPIWVDTTFGGLPPSDQDVATTQVGGADLRISKAVSPDPVVAGEQFTYSLDVGNDGPADARGVIVVDTLPAGVIYVSDTDGCTPGPGAAQVTCYLGDLEAGASDTFEIVVQISGPGLPAPVLSNSAAVSSDQDDPDLANNTAVATASVIIPVAINIKPGGFPNAINLNGQAPVAVLTTHAGEYGLPFDVDATTIDPATVRFGPGSVLLAGGGVPAVMGKGHLEDARDLNERTRDGDLDMVLQFRLSESGLTQASTQACVIGLLDAGGESYMFFGCDSVKVTP